MIIANGAYGMRMVRFMEVMKRPYVLLRAAETEQPDLSRIEEILRSDDALPMWLWSTAKRPREFSIR